MNKTQLLSQTAAFILVLTILLASPSMEAAAQAAGSDDQKEAMQSALAHKDFSAWTKLVADNEKLQLDEATFNWLVQAFYDAQHGNFDQAKILKQIVAAKQADQGSRARVDSWKERSKLNKALLTGDYTTWKELINNEDLETKITKAKFKDLVKAYRLSRAGEFEQATKIRTKLGLV